MQRLGVQAEFRTDEFDRGQARYVRGVKEAEKATQSLTSTARVLATGARDWDAIYRDQAQTMADWGHSFREVEEAFGPVIASQVEFAVNTQAAQQAVESSSTAVLDNAKAQRDLQRELERTEQSQGALTKKMALWTVGAATMYSLYMKVRRAFQEGVEELYGHTEQYKRFSEAVERTKLGFVAFIAPAGAFAQALDMVADVLTTVYQGMGLLQAALYGLGELTRLRIEMLGEVIRGERDWASFLTEIARGTETRAKAQEVFNTTLKSYVDSIEQAMTKTDDAADAQRNYEQALDRMVDMAFRARDAMREHADALRDIQIAYQENVARVAEQYSKRVAEIEEEYLDKRSDAYSDYTRDLDRARTRQQQDEEKDVARHLLNLEFMERKHRLRQLQNERVYQYRRGLLVAEGDVLAIEDLDARYQLERQAQEENFRLQEEQAQRMFDMQQRQQQMAFQQQVRALQVALAERLRAADEWRADELSKAEETRKEGMESAALDRMRETQAEQESYRRRIEQDARYWAELARQYDLNLQSLTRMVQTIYGPGSGMDTAILSAFTRWQGYATMFAGPLAGMMGMAPGGGLGGMLQRFQMMRTIFRQYGGADIATRPTAFIAGERGYPERVVVEPMTLGRGAMTVGWRGDAIPVYGTGSLEGADLSQIGNAIAKGLVTEMTTQLDQHRGKRG